MRKSSIAITILSLLVCSVYAEEIVPGEVIVKYYTEYGPESQNPASKYLEPIFNSIGVYEQETVFPYVEPNPSRGSWWDEDDWNEAYDSLGLVDWFVLKYSGTNSPEDVAVILLNTGYFEQVTPSHIYDYHIHVPGDLSNNQWYLYSSVSPDVDINAPEGWAYRNRMVRTPKIGIVDSGIWSSNGTYDGIHEDLRDNVDPYYLDDLDYFPNDTCTVSRDR